MNKRELHRDNYEEWFIDHLDGQLTEQEELLLQEFLLANPELAQELEGMDSVVLTPVAESFPDKGLLLIPTDQELALLTAVEEGDHSFLRNLGEDEQTEAVAWSRTILQADEQIIFPNKEALKKDTGGAIVPMWIMRFAAAASIVGAVLFLTRSEQDRFYDPRTAESSSSELFEEIVLVADYSEFESEETVDEESPVPTVERKKEAIIIPPAPLIVQEDTPLPFVIEDEPALAVEVPEQVEEPILSPEDNPEASLEPESFIEDKLASLEPISEPIPLEKGRIKEYSSVLDFVTQGLKKRAEDAEILAMDDGIGEAQYVETSIRIGRFSISRKSRKNRH